MTRLLVAGLAGAALAVAAAGPASADDAWLWACHGPSGDGLQTSPLTDAGGFGLKPFSFAARGTDASVVAGGDACAPGGAGGGLTGRLAAEPGGRSDAAVTVYVPPGLTLTGARLIRQTHGFGGAADLAYDARTANGVLESAGGDLAGDVTYPVASTPGSGDFVRLEARCDATPSQRCTGGPVSYDLSALALHVEDASRPAFALGAPGGAGGVLKLEIAATDVGTGLSSARVLIDGAVVATPAFSSCPDLSPGSAEIDLSLLAVCPTVATARPSIDISRIPEGAHTLTVKVFDAAGNETDESRPLTVTNHPDGGDPTATLTIATSVTAILPSPGGSGGVAGASASSCSRPRLSISLDQKPLRVRHRVPVLKQGKRYRFRGRLTCVRHHKRVSAPRRTRIDRLDRIGRRTVPKGGGLLRRRGRITFIVPAISSRTLIFRFVNGRRHVDVKIKVRVVRR